MPKVDITPDKSLVKKLGLTGYRTEQAVAELIDNSIDARIPGRREDIDVGLDFDRRTITVHDSGAGMDLEGLRDALTVAKETKDGDGRLGRFGLGMKSACSTLGRRFQIRTARAGSGTEYSATYDEDEWLGDESRGWADFEVNASRKEGQWHGTAITIKSLNIPLYPNQSVNFKRRFGIRYGPYLRDGQIRITVNSDECRPDEPEVEEGSRKEISIEAARGRIYGWMGLLKKRSIKGDFGMHLYRRGRLIKAFDKFGIRNHPEVAKVVGEIHLDHVPVNFHKTGFIEESYEYRDAVESFKHNKAVAGMLRSALRRKIGAAEISSILRNIGERPDFPIDTRISSRDAKALLKKADRFEIKGVPERAEMVFVDRESGLYSIKRDAGAFRIEVNRSSPVFRAFKNPLFLVGMIRVEAGIAMSDPAGLEGFLLERNRGWDGFVAGWTPGGERRARSGGNEAVPLPNYGLAEDLVGIHDHLMEWFPYDFQFTGLSTLLPFLHNAYNTIVYSVQTGIGAGKELCEQIRNAGGDFTVLYDPSREELEAAIELKRGKIIVARESSEKIGKAWAGPEKAWLDLYVEIVRKRLDLYRGELPEMLDMIVDSGLASLDKLRSLAAHRKLQDGIRLHMEA